MRSACWGPISTSCRILESTISELKTANNELQKDIEKKEQIDQMRRSFWPMYPMN